MARYTENTASGCDRTRGVVKYVQNGGRSINFLGYVFDGASVRLRKTIKQKFARRYSKAVRERNEKRQISLRASFKGWCKWGNGKHLYFSLTKENMSFSKLGIKSRPNVDVRGKRIFNEKFYPISNLVGMSICILDFEDGIETKSQQQQHASGDSGSEKPRCAVLFQFETGENAGKRGKFITSSHEIRDVLIQAREQENASSVKIFPCKDCKILTQRTGRYTNYYFED